MLTVSFIRKCRSFAGADTAAYPRHPHDEAFYFPYDFTVWQYSSKGSVDGVGGDVDMNVCMKDYAKEN